MKAIPLWQPWASLVAIEAKRIETRHWPAPSYIVGERVAIHATKTKDHLGVVALEPFLSRMKAAMAAGTLAMVDGELPLGAIIATAVVDRCSEMTWDAIHTLERQSPDERAFGNYEAGRFAWVLRDVERLAEPVPFRGSQGIFDVPDDLLVQGAPV